MMNLAIGLIAGIMVGSMLMAWYVAYRLNNYF
jgi:F0F1-type ATP synthase assembly protein I